ncbi:ESF1 homolog [Orussus abietinus]|uniref:ESF1 homolog n=1 Tax=Orussus abietinus TaxID=222816 RepID=UPI0006267B21|nr:ESF1 homolog [Orussus abietinus]XP_012278912.1 ESF1 homolog [Orussus abietinus]XP_023289800.1 ESF1 homolog [Orussus abietinus]
MDDIFKDARFAHIPKDPKFRKIPKSERKIKIDKRFRSMFSDKKFNVKYTIDKRGRPVNQTSTEDLKKYYDLSSDDESTSSDPDVKKPVKSKVVKKSKSKCKQKNTIEKRGFNNLNNGELLRIKPSEVTDSNSESSDEHSEINSIDSKDSKVLLEDLEENEKQLHIKRKNEKKVLTVEAKKKLRDLTIDYARGEGILATDSSSEEESSEYNGSEDEIEHDWGELDKEAEATDEITHRIAACNMDWDRIRALDLMVLFNSFLPSGGLIHSVTIYPSDFGLQRMKEEEIKGPIELVGEKAKSREIEEDENEEGSKYHMEKLRQYQLNRLKYYYAVIVCDSPETANKIYTECDGIEYESTATKLDLRFIPDDMTFDQDPREVCDKVPDFSKYQPRQFTTTALQQVKVELTWDETNPLRQEITQKLNSGKIDDVDENDLQAYLASGTSDEDSDDETNKLQNKEDKSDSESNDANGDPIEKYKSLLKSIEDQEEEKKKQDVELEVTWGLALKEKTEKLISEKMKKDKNLTPFEQYLEKRKEKKKTKREERKRLREEHDQRSDGSGSENSVPSDVDMNDPYFAEEIQNIKNKSVSQKRSKKSNEVESADKHVEEQNKAELELLMMGESDDENKHHFNMKQIEENQSVSKSKRKRLIKKKKDAIGAADDFEVNVKDERFAALFSSYHFNIDPADPHYRKTKGTEALINEKLKRRAGNEKNNMNNEKNMETSPTKESSTVNTELAALVKSVKRKAQNIHRPIK